MKTWQPIQGVFVLGLGHKARHGKDSAAQYLIRAYGSRVQRFSLAADLKAVCRVERGMQTKDPVLLQQVAEEYRAKDPDVWVKSVYLQIAEARPKIAVITDVRYPNEVEMIHALGGAVWKIERRDGHGQLYVDQSRPADHISETALDSFRGWDKVLVNTDGHPDYLRDRVVTAFAALGHEKGFL